MSESSGTTSLSSPRQAVLEDLMDGEWLHTTGEAVYLESGTWGFASGVGAAHKDATCSTGLYLMCRAKQDDLTLACYSHVSTQG